MIAAPKNELEYKRLIAGALRSFGWSVQEHEDSYANFIPDLSFGAYGQDGWIEVKYLDKVPKSLSAIKHWTAGQRDWLKSRGECGSGHCYLLAGAPTGHYLWRWDSLHNATRATWGRAVSLCALRDAHPPIEVLPFVTTLDMMIGGRL